MADKKEIVELDGGVQNYYNTVDIQNLIYVIRGQQVMLDSDLAMLYEVTTGALNQAVKRNIARFPEDFRFQLTEEEYETLKSQIVISNENTGRDRIIAKYEVNIDELCKEYNYEIYFQNNFRRVCYYYQVKETSYQYQECYDACLTAYLYSLYHCAISAKRDKDGYIMAYIRKLMKVYIIAALTVYNDANNICKINGFRRIDSDSYQV